MIWPFLILLGHKKRPKLLSRPWLLFHAQNVLELFGRFEPKTIVRKYKLCGRIFIDFYRFLNVLNFSKNGQRLLAID
jgi:hypothetical protein